MALLRYRYILKALSVVVRSGAVVRHKTESQSSIKIVRVQLFFLDIYFFKTFCFCAAKVMHLTKLRELTLLVVVWTMVELNHGGVIPLPPPGSSGEGPQAIGQLCPVVDCFMFHWPQLACDHRDTYITTFTIYEHECPGCPACRDYSYFKQLTQDLTKQVKSAAARLKQQKRLLEDSKATIQSLQLLFQTNTDDQSAADVESREQQVLALEAVFKQLEEYWMHSGIVKSVRYLEENSREIQQILKQGMLHDSIKISRDLKGFYQNLGDHPTALFDAIPYYERYRYAELLADFSLDKISQLLHRTLLLHEILTNHTEQVAAVTVLITSQKEYDNRKQDTPLLLRRLYELLESSKLALKVALDSGYIDKLKDSQLSLDESLKPTQTASGNTEEVNNVKIERKGKDLH